MTPEERLAVLETEVRDLRLCATEHSDSLQRIELVLAGASGGWKMLISVGAIAGGIGAAIVHFLPFWKP